MISQTIMQTCDVQISLFKMLCLTFHLSLGFQSYKLVDPLDFTQTDFSDDIIQASTRVHLFERSGVL